MKLLVAYDGSECSEAALDDLMQAGLPIEGEALIVSVAEVWLPPPNHNGNGTGIKLDLDSENLIREHYAKGKKAVVEAETLADHARGRLQTLLPGWQVKSEATYGSPAWEILTRADEFKPDLIVVGSHGRSAVSRLILGSISQKVLIEAHCSVRVARGGGGVGARTKVAPTPVRVVIGFDGSMGAQAAVAAVAERNWRGGSEVRLVAVTDPVRPSAIGRFVPPIAHLVEEVNQSEREWMEKLAENALLTLRAAGFAAASLHLHAGNPKQVLVEEAKNWGAHAIFVGANAFGNRVERFLIGSTSAAVAARAHCSVEIVRRKS